MATTPAPQHTESIDLRYFLEPLGSPAHPKRYLERFPDELYNKAPDSHFMHFMRTLLGPAGIGWLQQEMLDARLVLEALGVELNDLERFYGDPLSFGRHPPEAYISDVSTLLQKVSWETIKAQDSSYRSRAIEYVNAARLGTTPEGMRLAAQSGLGQNVEIIENYRALFDLHSDDPLGLPYYGSSQALGEFIVRPRATISRTVVQTLTFDQPITAGAFTVALGGQNLSYANPPDQPFVTPPLAFTVTALALAAALQALRTVGAGNVRVTGGPIPAPFVVQFTGALANRDLPLLVAKSDPNNPLTDLATGIVRGITVTATQGAIDPNSETVGIADIDRHHMQVALDNLRPVASYPTFSVSRGFQRQQPWGAAFASSEYVEVVKFVTGSSTISWPATDGTNWIRSTVEVQAPTRGDLQQHYTGFHLPTRVNAYTDKVVAGQTATTLPLLFPLVFPADDPRLPKYNSERAGSFSPQLCALIPYFNQFTNAGLVFSATDAITNYPDSLLVTGHTSDGTALIDRSYPINYAGLQGAPSLQRKEAKFWSSLDRSSGTDYLEIDLGSPQAVNFISFEITQKPVDITVAYDLLDQSPQRLFVPVVPSTNYLWDNAVFFNVNQQNPWNYLEFHFDDGLAMIYTRLLRLGFTRRVGPTPWANFLYDTASQTQTPWSIDVRNVRIGRNVAPTLA